MGRVEVWYYEYGRTVVLKSGRRTVWKLRVYNERQWENDVLRFVLANGRLVKTYMKQVQTGGTSYPRLRVFGYARVDVYEVDEDELRRVVKQALDKATPAAREIVQEFMPRLVQWLKG